MYLETPLERLHLDTELVGSVRGDPERLKMLAQGAFRLIQRVFHTDTGGDGSFIQEATDAIMEINGADDDELRLIVNEFFAVREGEDADSTGSSLLQQAKVTFERERTRRIGETQALLGCGFAEIPPFSKLLIELGITPYRGATDTYSPLTVEEQTILDVARPPEPQLALLDRHLQGHRLAVTKHTMGSYGLYSDGITIRRDGGITLDGLEVNMKTERQLNRSLVFKPTAALALNNVVILGMVDREHIEPSEDGDWVSMLQRPQLTSGSALTQQGDDYQPDWRPVAEVPWLQYTLPLREPATTIEDRYVVVARPRMLEVAVLGLQDLGINLET